MKQRRLRQIAVFLITAVMLLALTVTVFAAKENFRTCDHIGIRNCEAPVAGNHPDFDVSPYSPGQYEIMSVNWYKGTNPSVQTIMGSTMSFEGNTVYTVEFEVWAKDAYTFTTDSNGYTTVTADVGSGAATGEYSATVFNVYGQDNGKYLTVRCTFPKTGSAATIIDYVEITDIVEPCAGDKPSYASYVRSIDNAAFVQNIYWFNGGRQMTGNDKFVEGENYTVQVILIPDIGYEFATDPNHFFAKPGYPYTAVTGTINGKNATVLPDNERGNAATHIVVAATFTCKPSRQITHVEITGVTEPKTGEEPKYYVACGDTSYERVDLSNVYYAYGVAWLDGKENFVMRNQDLFLPSTAYTISITLKPTGDYIFAADEYGRPLVSATVNGKEAEVHKSSIEAGCIEVTYKFGRTASLEVSKVEVNDLEEPKSGSFPDYSVTYGDTTYTAQDYSDEFTRNGVVWYNDTTGEDMRPGVDKFKGGNTYTAYILIQTTGMYTFKYVEDTDSWTVTAKLNGKSAGTEEVYESTLTVWYQFTLPEDVHVCTPQKVEEVKATCTADGKKEHYFCTECSKFFEDAKCTKEIRDFLTWGITKATGHSGGKATCKDQAVCKNCGASYGELEAHKYGNGWDYKDANGHAHKCKECDAHDTVVPHTAGEAKCGQVSKCTECKAEYGEVIQHKWSSTLDYTDSKGHAHICSVCGDHDTIVGHSGGSADCKNKAKCSLCGTEYGKLGDHNWSTIWDYTDSKGHAHKCTVEGCDEHSDNVKHTPGAEATETSPQTCTECGYIVKPAKNHKHDLTKVKEVDPTCTENGCKQYYTCSGCDGIFSDSRGKEEITDNSVLIIPAAGHDLKWKANSSKHWQKCGEKGCDYELEDSKAEHEFDDENKCAVCGYNKKTGNVETEEPEVVEPTETEAPTDPDETKAPAEDTEPADDTKQDDGDSGNDAVWFIVGGAVLFGVLCMIVMIVVLSKKNKK